MNLADMLSYADINQLLRIAEHYQCECDGHSKHALIQSILSKVYRKEGFQSILEQLDDEDLRFLNSFLFDRKNAFSLEELLARAKYTQFEKKDSPPPLGATSNRETIARFKSRGWLFNGISRDSRYLFQFPEDLKDSFCEMLQARFEDLLTFTSDPPVYREEGTLLAEDTLKFLRMVEHETFPLNGTGGLYKKSLISILQSLSVAEQPVSQEVWRFGYGRRFKEYPSRFSLIYDFTFFQGYIKENTLLELTPLGQEKLQQAKAEDPLELYRFWLRLYRGPVYQLQELVQWIDRMASRWVSVKSLFLALRPFIRPFYYDDAQAVLEKRILRMLLHLGMVTLGEHPQAGAVVRMTSTGSRMVRGIHVREEDQIELG